MPNEVLATVEAVRGVRQLVTVCAAAEAGGLRVGQTLSQARALCPRLVAAEAEPTQDTAALAALAQWCTRATPLAAAGPPDTLWLDIGGCDHLLGGEARLAEDLADRMQRWGLLARWAVAGTTGAAYALARHAHAAVVPSGAEAAALAMLPIDALRLEPAVVAGLHRLGLRTIGALARLPRGELAARFGQVVLLRLDQAHGAVTEAIRWPPPPPDWTEQERLAEPILTTQACLTVLDLLARRLCNRLAAQRLGGRQFVAAFGIVDGSARQLAVATSRPVCDPAHLVRLLHETLDGLDPGFGIEAVSLGAPAIEASIVRQQDLMSAGHQEQQKLAQLIDMLANRLRPHGLWRTAPRDSHIPEHAVQTTPPLHGGIAWSHDPDAPRPIRLLRRPEPIEVTALLPDDPPIQFRWRGALHRVRAATGPERIAAEWWIAHSGGTRDYYNVEDTDGRRYWMFRDAAAWFLHGLFA